MPEFDSLYRRHQTHANAFASLLAAGTSIDPRELVDEAFLVVLSDLAEGRGADEAFRMRLLRTIRSRFANKAQHADVPVRGENIQLAAAFVELPEQWQLVLWHLYAEGNPPRVAAELLGVRVEAVLSLAARAAKGLRHAYGAIPDLGRALRAVGRPAVTPRRDLPRRIPAPLRIGTAAAAGIAALICVLALPVSRSEREQQVRAAIPPSPVRVTPAPMVSRTPPLTHVGTTVRAPKPSPVISSAPTTPEPAVTDVPEPEPVMTNTMTPPTSEDMPTTNSGTSVPGSTPRVRK